MKSFISDLKQSRPLADPLEDTEPKSVFLMKKFLKDIGAFVSSYASFELGDRTQFYE